MEIRKIYKLNNPTTPEEKLVAELVNNLLETVQFFIKLNALAMDNNKLLGILNNGVIGFIGNAIFTLSETVKKDELKSYINFVKKHINFYLDDLLKERGIQ